MKAKITVFQPELRPRIMKTNINKITQYVAKRITEIGYNVYISYSTRSRSRYLEVRLSESRMITIRISDHPAGYNKLEFGFDIYTIKKRKGSMDYIEFIDVLKQIVGYAPKEE